MILDLPRRSRFVVGSLDWTTPFPVSLWTPAQETVGQTRITTLGIPAGERIREDRLLALGLRFHEEDWLAVEAFLRAGLTSTTIEFYPEAEDPGTVFECWLHVPAPGESWGPVRSGEFARVMTIEIVLRGAFGAAPWASYFESEA